jgi:hypothetical protein
MTIEKVFVWFLQFRAQSGNNETIVFSASGEDREEAENKIFAYFKSLGPVPGLTPEMMYEWAKTVTPLTPEVKEGVWLLHLTTTVQIG